MKLHSMKFALSLTMCLGLTLNSFTVLAQTKQSQMQCKAKAKEASKIAFDDCMVLAKEGEVENLKKEYKVKVTKLKEYYIQKIKKLVGQKKKENQQNAVIPASNSGGALPTTLPQKVETPIVTESESSKSNFEAPVPVNTTTSSPTANSSNEDSSAPSSAEVTDTYKTEVSDVPSRNIIEKEFSSPASRNSEPTVRLREVSPKAESLLPPESIKINEEPPATL